MPHRATTVSTLFLLCLLTSCGSIRYDLANLPFDVSAKPAADGAGEPFSITSKYVLYVHGLLGDKQPPVAELLREHCRGSAAITAFRVAAGASIWDWLGTHLSLGFVRLKTVTISGRRSAPAR